ncbi:MAG: hypothetical protein AB1600_00300 [Bacteroidota bacterium]
MISISGFTKERVFIVRPKELKLTRRYEEEQYAFVAGDVKLQCVDAQELYAAVTAGEEVSFVAFRDQTCIFRGTFQAEGTSFDPEKMEYSFTVVHVAKKIFEKLKSLKLPTDSSFRHSYGSSDHEWNGYELDVLFVFAQQLSHENYFGRNFWIDLAKHVRGVLNVDNNLVSGFQGLELLSRKKIGSILHIGYDDLIADYKEEHKNPDYAAVFFPAQFIINQLPAHGFVRYTESGLYLLLNRFSKFFDPGIEYGFGDVLFKVHDIGAELDLSDNLDLRVPSSLFDNKFPAELPSKYVPMFKFSNPSWIGISPIEYCERHFYSAVNPYKEVDVLYRELLPVNPLEKIAVQGVNVQITEIEDDLVNETTKIIGRKFV